jgi:hypothetical protein
MPSIARKQLCCSKSEEGASGGGRRPMVCCSAAPNTRCLGSSSKCRSKGIGHHVLVPNSRPSREKGLIPISMTHIMSQLGVSRFPQLLRTTYQPSDPPSAFPSLIFIINPNHYLGLLLVTALYRVVS